jgi:hypothetical protein
MGAVLASMRTSEQIDALDSLSIDSFSFHYLCTSQASRVAFFPSSSKPTRSISRSSIEQPVCRPDRRWPQSTAAHLSADDASVNGTRPPASSDLLLDWPNSEMVTASDCYQITQARNNLGCGSLLRGVPLPDAHVPELPSALHVERCSSSSLIHFPDANRFNCQCPSGSAPKLIRCCCAVQ